MSDAAILVPNNGQGSCVVACVGSVHVPLSAELQGYARQTACRVGVSQDLLLAVLIKEHQLEPPGANAVIAEHVDPSKSLGIASMKYATAKGLIDEHQLQVAEAKDRNALIERLDVDPRLAIELAAYLLKDGKDAGLTDKGAFVIAYTQPSGEWGHYRAAGEDTARYPTGHSVRSQSLRDRAKDYDHITAVLRAADDWLSLPPEVRTRALQDLRPVPVPPGQPPQHPEPSPSLPYDVPPTSCPAPSSSPSSPGAGQTVDEDITVNYTDTVDNITRQVSYHIARSQATCQSGTSGTPQPNVTLFDGFFPDVAEPSGHYLAFHIYAFHGPGSYPPQQPGAYSAQNQMWVGFIPGPSGDYNDQRFFLDSGKLTVAPDRRNGSIEATGDWSFDTFGFPREHISGRVTGSWACP